jgi:hypothetical protein
VRSTDPASLGGNDSKLRLDSLTGALHRPRVGGGMILKLRLDSWTGALHRPCVGGGTTFKLIVTRGPVPSTDPVSVRRDCKRAATAERSCVLAPVAANRASTDTRSVESAGLGVCRVAPNRASTDTGSAEGGELVVRRVAPNRASTAATLSTV